MSFNCPVRLTDGGDKLEIAAGGTLAIDPTAVMAILEQASVAGTGMTVVERVGPFFRTRTTFSGLSVTMTDAGAAGCHGTAELFTFPEAIAGGFICPVKISADMAITASGSIGATAALVLSIGTAAVGVDNATLTGTEADILASTAATLSSSAATVQAAYNPATAGVAAGSAANLNFAIPDAGASGNGALSLIGGIDILWAVLGN